MSNFSKAACMLLLAAGIVSCNNDFQEIESVAKVKTVFQSGFESQTFQNSIAKTQLGADGHTIYFSGDESIQVLSSKSESPCIFLNTSGKVSTSCDFIGEIEEADQYYAAYPSSSVKAWNGQSVTMQLIGSQSAVLGGFDPNAHLYVAKTGGDQKYFQFKNVCAYLKITTTQNLRSLTFSAESGKKLVGEVKVDTGDPTVIDLQGQGSNVISLLPFGSDFIAPGTYYLSVLPCTLSSLTVTAVGENSKSVSKTCVAQILFERAKIANFGTVTFNFEETAQEEEVDYKNGEWFDGTITTYNKSGDYPWPISQYCGIESGYYKCAPAYSEPAIGNFLFGTCYEIQYGDKTIKVIADDICPDVNTTFIDLEADGFTALTGLTTGNPAVKIREIPYITNENLKLVVKPGSNPYFLGCWVFNGRYPVSNIEISWDGGKSYRSMRADNQHNEFWDFQTVGSTLFEGDVTFRITDKYGHQVIGVVSNFTDGSVNDLGANFEY